MGLQREVTKQRKGLEARKMFNVWANTLHEPREFSQQAIVDFILHLQSQGELRDSLNGIMTELYQQLVNPSPEQMSGLTAQERRFLLVEVRRQQAQVTDMARNPVAMEVIVAYKDLVIAADHLKAAGLSIHEIDGPRADDWLLGEEEQPIEEEME